MKGTWFQKFSQDHLLPHFPGFKAKGKFLFKVPVGPMFRGFVFDSSGFSKEAFYPQVYVQPLYVPSSYTVLTFGERFIGSWKVVSGKEEELGTKLLECIRSIGLPFLEALGSPEKLAHPPSPWKNSKNSHIQQAIAYSLAYVSDHGNAIKVIEEVCKSIRAENDKRDWLVKLLGELESFRELLAKDPAQARKQLNEWTEETRANLRLPE